MKVFSVWLTPPPNFEEHGEFYPNSTKVHFVSSKMAPTLPVAAFGKTAYLLTESQLDPLLRYDAELWADFATGDDRKPNRFDHIYAANLFAAYKELLEQGQDLDFTVPMAGVKL